MVDPSVYSVQDCTSWNDSAFVIKKFVAYKE